MNVAAVLPAAEWRHRPGVAALLAALGEGTTRWVGGAVRDTLLGQSSADLDLATSLPPEEVVRRLDDARIKAIPTGIAHGTITAVSSGTVVEVTTLRRDVATDGRHAVVAFTDDWQADAARRDFTINALYAEPISGELFDWFGGLDDLAARRVRFIGDPLQRIAEDHLRILRFFRFHARFGERIDPDGLAACVARANDMMALSRERIAAELLKLLVAPNTIAVVALMVSHDVLRPVLPEIDAAGVTRLQILAAAEMRSDTPPHAIRRLAALLPPSAAESVGARLKLSNADRKRLIAATAGPGSEGARALAYRIGVDGARDRLLLAGEDPATLDAFIVPRLPIGGGDLVGRGLARGPDVARVLREVENAWIARDFDDSAVSALADAAVAQALRVDRNA